MSSELANISITQHASGQLAVAPKSYLGGSLWSGYLNACRSVGGRYDAETRSQLVAPERLSDLFAALRDAGLEPGLSPEFRAELERTQADAKQIIADAHAATSAALADAESRGLRLYPFQAAGVAWLRDRAGALLADEMGCGKTIQALAALPPDAKVVVIAPAAVKGVWRTEARRWRPDLTVRVLAGRGSFRWPGSSLLQGGEAVVTNYDILPDIVAAPPEGVILIADEAHLLKSSRAKRTERFRLLAQAVLEHGGKVWLLTGTPLLNRPPELWNVLQAAEIAQGAFGNYRQFKRAFDARTELIHAADGRKVYRTSFGSPTNSVGAALQRVSLRRRRIDVLPELPTKTHESRLINGIDDETRGTLDRFLASLEAAGMTIDDLFAQQKLTREQRAVIFETLSRVRAALATAKIPAMLEIVEQYEEAETPVVVFSAHRAPIDVLGARDGWATITGDTAAEERTAIVERFQNGELRGVAATIQAGGVGLTLTQAHHALFVDLAWTPALNQQAEDRVCRIGQDRGVLVIRLVAEHPVDERVIEILSQKQELIEASVEQSARKGTSVEDAARALVAQELAAAEETARIISEAPEVTAPRNREPQPAAERKEIAPGIAIPVAEAAHGKRGPETDEERAAAAGILYVAGMDADHASTRNDVGFSKFDNDFGHSLAEQLTKWGRLSERQWAAVLKLAKRYRRQIGEMPGNAGEAE